MLILLWPYKCSQHRGFVQYILSTSLKSILFSEKNPQLWVFLCIFISFSGNLFFIYLPPTLPEVWKSPLNTFVPIRCANKSISMKSFWKMMGSLASGGISSSVSLMHSFHHGSPCHRNLRNLATSFLCGLPCLLDLTFLIFSLCHRGAHTPVHSRERVHRG